VQDFLLVQFTRGRLIVNCANFPIVELDQVSQFMNEEFVWPENRPGVDAIADRISRLLEVPCVVVVTHFPQEIVGSKIVSEMNLSQIEREGFVQFIKSYLKKVSSDLFRVRRVQLQGAVGVRAQSLTLVRFGDVKISGQIQYGTVILCSNKQIDSRSELALLVIAQRLCELARIFQFQIELNLRNQFLSIASHELKTPLTAIYGILQLQARMMKAEKSPSHLSDPDRYEHFLKISMRQVERLNELIDGLLDVSRIQNGRFAIEPIETQVSRVLQDCIHSRLQVISQEAGVSLQIEAPQSLIAWVDPVRLEELITNLVMNAIRFSPEGGVVWITLRQEEGGFRLTVRDQGPSVPEEDRDRIFQPFERAQRTSRLGGLGLGLFISRQIAQLHGGSVNLTESVPGKGNVFEAYFPTRAPQSV
jgi:signal transduction histidine kinase